MYIVFETRKSRSKIGRFNAAENEREEGREEGNTNVYGKRTFIWNFDARFVNFGFHSAVIYCGCNLAAPDSAWKMHSRTRRGRAE